MGGWRLTGRDGALGVATRRAGAGQPGVVLVGEPGIGKTRLAREVLARREAAGAIVRWVGATESARSLPLGAFQGLVPLLDREDMIGAAVLHLAGLAPGRSLVLGIDDAHLLDDSSAALVHQLAIARVAALVVTVRPGAGEADAVTALWKDGLLERLDLGALDRADVASLLESALDGPVETATVERLVTTSRGNPLYLREMVGAGLASGVLHTTAGVWQWRGTMPRSAGLRELVQRRLAGLGADERALLELAALGEPLGFDVVRELCGAAVVTSLEAQDLLTSTRLDRRNQVRIAHPLYAEVLRAELPATRATELRRTLVAALGQCPDRRGGDRLMRAAMLLELGDRDPSHAELFLEATRRAKPDYPLAERFARAALESGGGAAAAGQLARTLAWQGRLGEAEAAIGRVATLDPTDDERASAATWWATTLYWVLGRRDEARALLDTADAAVGDDYLRHGINGRRAGMATSSGEPLRALELARPVLAAAAAPDSGVCWAAVAAITALGGAGRLGEALTVAQQGHVRAAATMDPNYLAMVAAADAWARRLAGDLAGSRGVADELLATMQHRPGVASALATMLLGQLALAEGRLGDAQRWLQEAIAGFTPFDPGGWLATSLRSLAEVHALAGRADDARDAFDAATRAPVAPMRLFEPETMVTEAWIHAASFERDRAIAVALDAADLAAARGQPLLEVHCLHHALRFGFAAPRGRLARVAGALEGPLPACFGRHADAFAAADGDALVAVAAEFDRLGARLLAAEASAHAADAFRRAGRAALHHAAAERARTLAIPCGAVTPALALIDDALPLTTRQAEVARLAATGLSSKEIAQRLSVSERTIEGHLDRIYRQLGVSGRGELARALARA